MNADQLSEALQVIREVIADAPDTCIILEVAEDPSRWVQIVDHTINAAYPHETDARHVLEAFPKLTGMQLSAWEPNTFATFDFEGADVGSLARWIDAYFVLLLGCEEGQYNLKAGITRL